MFERLMDIFRLEYFRNYGTYLTSFTWMGHQVKSSQRTFSVVEYDIAITK